MIGKLRGVVEHLNSNSAIIDVGGVGYVVYLGTRSLAQLAEGQAVSLYIETIVREDAFNLFGFLSRDEQAMFNLLTTVQGVGAKVGLALLSSLSPAEMTAAIARADKTALCRADGVGPKLALRLITELKDKVGHLGIAAQAGSGRVVDIAATASLPNVAGDAISALVNLGYKRADVFAVVNGLSQNLGAEASLNDFIKAALAELAA